MYTPSDTSVQYFSITCSYCKLSYNVKHEAALDPAPQQQLLKVKEAGLYLLASLVYLCS